MRLFIAILLENNMITALTDAQNALRIHQYIGRYTDKRNLHLTLAFIGDFNDPDLVLEKMEQVRISPFEIALNGYLGNFGDLLWAGMESCLSLDQYVRQLRHLLADSQIPFDRKNFHPHITLLRNAQRGKAFSEISVSAESMTVQKISLMRSDFGKHGAVYTEIGAVECCE